MRLSRNSDVSCFTLCALLAIGIVSSYENIEGECWKSSPRFAGDFHPDVVISTSATSQWQAWWVRTTDITGDVVSGIEYISNAYETLRKRCPHHDYPATRSMIKPRINSKPRNILNCPVLRSRSNYPLFIHRDPVTPPSTHRWHISRTLP